MHHYNLQLVLLSYVVAALGSFTALRLIGDLAAVRPGRERTLTLVTAAAVMGLGAIWAMHFIAMLAYHFGMPVTYDISLTAASALVAVVACFMGLSLAARERPSMMNFITSGSFMGIGVALMHYMGMAAMRMAAYMWYDGAIAALAALIAIVASIAALWIAFKHRGPVQTVVGALVMGVAVCGMHYTGMAGAHFEPNGQPIQSGGLGGQHLAVVVFAMAATLMAVVLVRALVRQRRLATGF